MLMDTNGNTKVDFITLTHEEIWDKIYYGTYTLVHLKETMEPKLYDNDNKKFIDVPDGYLEYDQKRYYRKI